MDLAESFRSQIQPNEEASERASRSHAWIPWPRHGTCARDTWGNRKTFANKEWPSKMQISMPAKKERKKWGNCLGARRSLLNEFNFRNFWIGFWMLSPPAWHDKRAHTQHTDALDTILPIVFIHVVGCHTLLIIIVDGRIVPKPNSFESPLVDYCACVIKS